MVFSFFHKYTEVPGLSKAVLSDYSHKEKVI